MNLRVALVESFARGDERCRGQAIREQAVERRAQLIALAGVAQIELAREAARRQASMPSASSSSRAFASSCRKICSA